MGHQEVKSVRSVTRVGVCVHVPPVGCQVVQTGSDVMSVVVHLLAVEAALCLEAAESLVKLEKLGPPALAAQALVPHVLRWRGTCEGSLSQQEVDVRVGGAPWQSSAGSDCGCLRVGGRRGLRGGEDSSRSSSSSPPDSGCHLQPVTGSSSSCQVCWHLSGRGAASAGHGTLPV